MPNLQGVFRRQKHPDSKTLWMLITSLEGGTESELNPSPPALSWAHITTSTVSSYLRLPSQYILLFSQPRLNPDRSIRILPSAGFADELFIIKAAVTNAPPGKPSYIFKRA